MLMSLAHNVVEPTVIDDELLGKAVNEQATGDAAEIARKEGIDFGEVTSLRLDYKNVLKIDHLWQFEALTKLQLDNNIIEKIEGIAHLKFLTWLDLSFNNISVIEGLDELVHLTDLSLFNNRISRLENMDNLTKLNVFSIGNNDIQDIQQLAYLARFENLRLLNVSGNPLCRNTEYKGFILARLRHLKYLDYRLVEPAMVTAAQEKYVDDIIALEEEAKVARKAAEAAARARALDEQHARAHVPRITALFGDMVATDADFQRLRCVGAELLDDQLGGFRAAFDGVVADLVAHALRQRDVRDEEVADYSRGVLQAVIDNDKTARAALDAFMHTKKGLIRQIGKPAGPPGGAASAGPGGPSGGGAAATAAGGQADLPVGAAAGLQLRVSLATLSDELIGLELYLVEQFEDLLKEFERAFTDLVNSAREYGTACFTRLRELTNEYHEKFAENVTAGLERQGKSDLDELDDVLRDLLRDKDAVQNHLQGSHDHQLSRIDAQEEAYNSGLNKELDWIIGQAHIQETRRHRTRLTEVVLFQERCVQEVEQAEDAAS